MVQNVTVCTCVGYQLVDNVSSEGSTDPFSAVENYRGQNKRYGCCEMTALGFGVNTTSTYLSQARQPFYFRNFQLRF